MSDSVGGSGKKRRMGMVDSTRLRGCVLQPVVDWDIFSIYVNGYDKKRWMGMADSWRLPHTTKRAFSMIKSNSKKV